METNYNMATMPTARDQGAGVQAPLSPPDMWIYSDIFDTVQGNITGDDSIAPITDDKLAYQLDDNESSVISPHHTCDNAVDPSVYFADEHNRHTSPCWESDTLSTASSPCNGFIGDMQNASPLSDNTFPNDSRFINQTPGFARQHSLKVAMEVLGTFPVDDGCVNINHLAIFPPTSSSCDCGDDDFLQHPSPSYVGFSSPIPAPQRDRVFSDFLPASEISPIDNIKTRAFSMDDGYLQSSEFSNIHLPFENYTSLGEAMEDSEAASPDSNVTNTNATSSPDNVSSSHQSASSFAQTTSVTAATSMVNTSVEQTLGMSENSLISLLDFMRTGDPTLQAVQTSEDINSPSSSVSQACVMPPEAVCVEVVSSPISTPALSPVIDLTDETPSTSGQSSASVPKLKRTSSYKRKRTQNNKSCRESRKKRKLQRDEAEKQVAELTKDNEATRKRIQELEAEVEQTRSILMGRLSGKT